MRMTFGDDIIRRFWKDQEVVLSRDIRQMTEFMVRGRYAMGIGAVRDVILPEFLAEGLGRNLKHLELDGIEHVSGGSDLAYIFNRPPHPNAAKLFVNWILTKEAQDLWSRHASINSRRVDLPPANPEAVATPGKKYIKIDSEELVDEVQKTQDIAKAVLG